MRPRKLAWRIAFGWHVMSFVRIGLFVSNAMPHQIIEGKPSSVARSLAAAIDDLLF